MKRLHRVWLTVVLTVVLMGVLPSALVAGNTDEDMAFENNLELLDIQMELLVLERLYNLGFYIPGDTIEQYQTRQQDLLTLVRAGERMDCSVAVKWAEEDQKVAEAENLALQKLAESMGKKILRKTAASAQAVREFDKTTNEWRMKKKGSALEVARYVEGLLASKRNKGVSIEDEKRDLSRALKRLYRGSIKDTDRLVNSLVELQKKRCLIEGSLKLMGDVQKGLDLIDKMEDPGDVIKTHIDQSITGYLRTIDGDVDPAAIKTVTSSLKTVGESAWGAWSELEELDKDKKMNPAVRRAAKQYAVLGAIYSSTVGVVKDVFGDVPAAGPFLDIFEFYGDAIGLIPTIAQKISAVVQKVDQGYKDARALNQFADVPSDVGLFQITAMGKRYGLPFGYDKATDERAANRFYYVVPEDLIPRGYATLSQAQYQRLDHMLSDERLLNALSEARRAVPVFTEDALDERMKNIETLPDDLMSPVADKPLPSFVQQVREKSTAVPFSSQELLDMAKSTDDKAELWEIQRETMISVLAKELAVRQAVTAFKGSYLEEWDSYIEILERADVPLAPRQILNLFNFTVTSGENRERLKEVLERKREERLKNRLGTPRIGIPLIEFAPSDMVVGGDTIGMEATIIISGIAPGRKLAAKAVWTMPPWAKARTVTQNLTLVNGLVTLKQTLRVPKDVKGTEHLIKLRIETEEIHKDIPPAKAVCYTTFFTESKIRAWALTAMPIVNPKGLKSSYNDSGTHEDDRKKTVFHESREIIRAENAFTCKKSSRYRTTIKFLNNRTKQESTSYNGAVTVSWEHPPVAFGAHRKFTVKFQANGVGDTPMWSGSLQLKPDYKDGDALPVYTPGLEGMLFNPDSLFGSNRSNWDGGVTLTGPKGEPGDRLAVYVGARNRFAIDSMLSGPVVLYVYEFRVMTHKEYEELLSKYSSLAGATPPPVRVKAPLRKGKKRR